MYARLWATEGPSPRTQSFCAGVGAWEGSGKKTRTQGHLRQCKKLRNSPTRVTGGGGILHPQVGET